MSQPSQPLKPSQKRTLDAWKIALKRVDIAEFPEELKAEIKQIEKELEQNNYQILDKIPDIVCKNSELSNAYKTARKELADAYNSQEKTKTSYLPVTNQSTFKITNSTPKTKKKINRKAILILQALDTYPLTLEDLKYRLSLPSWEVHKLVKQLWNERKINTLSGSIWYNLLPINKPGELNIENDDSDTYFTLTSLGTLQLRTLINSR